MLVEWRVISCSFHTFCGTHEVSPCQRCFLPQFSFPNFKLKLTVDTRVHRVSVAGEINSTIADALLFHDILNDEALPTVTSDQEPTDEDDRKDDAEEEINTPGISKIRVSRQKYIPISKTELMDAIVRTLFESRGDDPSSFIVVSTLLDSIIHAEHKEILEELRKDYSLIEGDGDSPHSTINTNGFESPKIDHYEWDLKKILGYSNGNDRDSFTDRSNKMAVATRFQSAFMQLLDNAQFQELSPRDLTLASSLNSDYILTLPIYVDWKKASESNAIIFRRGYTTEKQKGLMLAEKLDYLQSRLLQRVFSLVSKPLRKFGIWIKRKLKDSSETEELSDLLKRMATWQEDSSFFQFFKEADAASKDDTVRELPIWLAAQKAVTRYEGFLSPVGPRGRLFRKLLTRVGLEPALPEEATDDTVSISLSRVSLSDIWRPVTRKYCGNNFWKMMRTSFSILLSSSYLQEPAFQELILLYNKEPKAEEKSPFSPLQLKIYERIPIPDLPVVFPAKKLSFRILDTVRLDLATILGLMAFFINYKFEDILSSPSAVVLDFVATSALILFVSRVVLGYKRTWDRYQLLVNKTLYEKTLASGFGSVYFLLDASEQQQYKEALLAYAILLKAKNDEVVSRESLSVECERFLYAAFKMKVEMPVHQALNTLLRLGLAKENAGLWAVPCDVAHQALRQRWNSMLR